MSKRLQFDVELTVSNDIDADRAAEVLEAMLVDLQQDSNYHDVLIINGVESHDESTVKLLDILDQIEDTHIDEAIAAVERGDIDE